MFFEPHYTFEPSFEYCDFTCANLTNASVEFVQVLEKTVDTSGNTFENCLVREEIRSIPRALILDFSEHRGKVERQRAYREVVDQLYTTHNLVYTHTFELPDLPPQESDFSYTSIEALIVKPKDMLVSANFYRSRFKHIELMGKLVSDCDFREIYVSGLLTLSYNIQKCDFSGSVVKVFNISTAYVKDCIFSSMYVSESGEGRKSHLIANVNQLILQEEMKLLGVDGETVPSIVTQINELYKMESEDATFSTVNTRSFNVRGDSFGTELQDMFGTALSKKQNHALGDFIRLINNYYEETGHKLFTDIQPLDPSLVEARARSLDPNDMFLHITETIFDEQVAVLDRFYSYIPYKIFGIAYTAVHLAETPIKELAKLYHAGNDLYKRIRSLETDIMENVYGRKYFQYREFSGKMVDLESDFSSLEITISNLKSDYRKNGEDWLDEDEFERYIEDFKTITLEYFVYISLVEKASLDRSSLMPDARTVAEAADDEFFGPKTAEGMSEIYFKEYPQSFVAVFEGCVFSSVHVSYDCYPLFEKVKFVDCDFAMVESKRFHANNEDVVFKACAFQKCYFSVVHDLNPSQRKTTAVKQINAARDLRKDVEDRYYVATAEPPRVYFENCLLSTCEFGDLIATNFDRCGLIDLIAHSRKYQKVSIRRSWLLGCDFMGASFENCDIDLNLNTFSISERVYSLFQFQLSRNAEEFIREVWTRIAHLQPYLLPKEYQGMTLLYMTLNLAFRYYLEGHKSFSSYDILDSIKELVKESSVSNDFSGTMWKDSTLKTQRGTTYKDIGTFRGAKGLDETPNALR